MVRLQVRRTSKGATAGCRSIDYASNGVGGHGGPLVSHAHEGTAVAMRSHCFKALHRSFPSSRVCSESAHLSRCASRVPTITESSCEGLGWHPAGCYACTGEECSTFMSDVVLSCRWCACSPAMVTATPMRRSREAIPHDYGPPAQHGPAQPSRVALETAVGYPRSSFACTTASRHAAVPADAVGLAGAMSSTPTARMP